MKHLLPVLFVAALWATPVKAQKKPKEYNAVIVAKNQRYKGFIEDVSADGITIDHYGKSKFISADSLSSIKVKGSKALRRSALYGSAVGVLAGTAFYIQQNKENNYSPLAIPVFVIGSGLAGTGIGALINSVTSVQRYAELNQPGAFKRIYPELHKFSEAYQSGKRRVVADDTPF